MKNNIKYISVLVVLFLQLNLFSQDALTADILNATTESHCEDGAIDLHINGGFSPYDVIWNYDESWPQYGINGNDGEEDLAGLEPGIYTVTVTDALCGTVEHSIEVDCEDCPPIYINFETTDVVCVEQSDPFMGSIKAIPYGNGVEPYTYEWSNGSNSQTITNIPPNTYYKVIVTDSRGCQEEDFEFLRAITEPIYIQEDFIVECFSNWLYDIEVIGDFDASFNFYWTGNNFFQSTERKLQNMPAGSYALEIRDPSNPECLYAYGWVIAKGEDLVFNIYNSNTCSENDYGSAFIYSDENIDKFSFYWDYEQEDSGNIRGDLAVGNHTVKIESNDPDVCFLKLYNFTVFNLNEEILNPEYEVTPICSGTGSGEIVVTGIPNTTFYYRWAHIEDYNSGSFDGITLSNITEPGYYTLLIADWSFWGTNNCVEEVEIYVPNISDESFEIIEEIGVQNCEPGSIEVLMNYESNFEYEWNDDNNTTGNTLTTEIPGEYCVTVMDIDLQCEQEYCVTVKNDMWDIRLERLDGISSCREQDPDSQEEGFIEVSVVDPTSTGDFSFLWNTGETTPSISGGEGSYRVVVTDNNTGCTLERTFKISCCYEWIEGYYHDQMIKVDNMPPIIMNPQASMSNGSIHLNIENNGGGGVIDWMYGADGTGQVFSHEENVENLEPGWYSVKIDNGCEIVTESFEMISCEELESRLNISLKVTGCEAGLSTARLQIYPVDIPNFMYNYMDMDVNFWDFSNLDRKMEDDAKIKYTRWFINFKHTAKAFIRIAGCDFHLTKSISKGVGDQSIDENLGIENACVTEILCDGEPVGTVNLPAKFHIFEEGEDGYNSLNPCSGYFYCTDSYGNSSIRSTQTHYNGEVHPFNKLSTNPDIPGECWVECDCKINGEFYGENTFITSIPCGDIDDTCYEKDIVDFQVDNELLKESCQMTAICENGNTLELIGDMTVAEVLPVGCIITVCRFDNFYPDINWEDNNLDFYIDDAESGFTYGQFSFDADPFNIDFEEGFYFINEHCDPPPPINNPKDVNISYYRTMKGDEYILSTLQEDIVNKRIYIGTAGSKIYQNTNNATLAVKKYVAYPPGYVGNQASPLLTATSTVIDLEGEAYYTGNYVGVLTDNINFTYSSKGMLGSFITKYDNDNNLLWSKNLTSDTSIEVESILTNSNNEVIVIGSLEGMAEIETNSFLSSQTKSQFMIKYSSSGELLLSEKLEDVQFKNYNVTSNDNEEIVISGVDESRNPILMKYDQFGFLVFEKQLSNFSAQFSKVEVLENENMVTIIEGEEGNSISNGSRMILTDKEGNIIWDKPIGREIDRLTVKDVASSNGDYFYIIGEFEQTISLNETDMLVSNGRKDLFIAKIDLDGNVINTRVEGGVMDEFVEAFNANSDGEYAYIGYSFSNTAEFSNHSFTNNTGEQKTFVSGFNDFNPLPLVQAKTGSNSMDSSSEISIYPIPTDNIIKIESIGKHSFDQFIINDLLGKLIDSKKIEENKGSIIEYDCTTLKPGAYFIQFINKGKNIRTLKIIKV